MLSLLASLVGVTSAITLTCHCKNGLPCHTNGFCDQGCDNGWHGPGCQVSNVALRKLARQSTNYSDGGYLGIAELAVDGRVPSNSTSVSCSHTIPQYYPIYPSDAVQGAAWWAVTLDLRNKYVITGITIVNRRGDYGSRLTNFLILYSNDTESHPDPISNSWRECAREIGVVGNQRTYACNNTAIAKRVAVYLKMSASNSLTILTLCEVQIYGYQHYDCPRGFTGPGCLLRACDQCESTGRQCTGDYGGCRYDVCPDQSFLPPDCWITLSNFSGINLHSSATCNSMMLSLVLPDSKPNIAATLVQLQLTTSDDRQVLANATFPVQTTNSAYYNFSGARANASYNVSVKLLYCGSTGSSCFHKTGSQVFTVWTGKREYHVTNNNSAMFIDVRSSTVGCELPSAIQVTCESQDKDRSIANSSSLAVFGLKEDREYNCSITAIITDTTIERLSIKIVTGQLSSLSMPVQKIALLAGSIGGSAAAMAVVVAIAAYVHSRRKRDAKHHALAAMQDACSNFYSTADALERTSVPLTCRENCENLYESLSMNTERQTAEDYTVFNFSI